MTTKSNPNPKQTNPETTPETDDSDKGDERRYLEDDDDVYDDGRHGD